MSIIDVEIENMSKLIIYIDNEIPLIIHKNNLIDVITNLNEIEITYKNDYGQIFDRILIYDVSNEDILINLETFKRDTRFHINNLYYD